MKADGRPICPVCGGGESVYDHERGEIVCTVCGAVIAENVADLGPEWRAFDDEERRSKTRVGPPTIRLTSESLMTSVDWDDKDAKGEELDFKRRLIALRLRRWHNKSKVQTVYERNLVEALRVLERLKSAMGMPRSCIERAMELYRQALMRELNKGQSIEAMAAAALYMACRLFKMPRPLDEFAKYTMVSRKRIARCYRLMLRGLNIKMPLDNPMLHVRRIAGRLGLPDDVVNTAMKILRKAKAAGLTVGKEPAGIAASALYLAAHLHGVMVTQNVLATMAGVAEVTVRQGSKMLAKVLGIERRN